eukprot:CAMPEP_0184684670 /NCGR_PEP_ID=MMETSP0312-20130426/16252_1 /TAXON_ID=31354 /ORGANISM="Compsopogon coeruleus, Strain SAG 36.94" /LENGTH=511 /DNA_ID=CAMNT_0027138091 /DNA_START=132 /DNA_END=1667 /DNA_ORIENTATION=-
MVGNEKDRIRKRLFRFSSKPGSAKSTIPEVNISERNPPPSDQGGRSLRSRKVLITSKVTERPVTRRGRTRRGAKREDKGQETLRVDGEPDGVIGRENGDDVAASNELDHEEDPLSDAIGYFEAHRGGRGAGEVRLSNRSMKDWHLVDDQENIVGDEYNHNKTFVQERLKLWDVAIQSMRSRWPFLLRTGSNILCYGWGSKRALLHEFAQTVAIDGAVVEIDGFNPALSLKQVLISAMDCLSSPSLNGKKTAGSRRSLWDLAGSVQMILDEAMITGKNSSSMARRPRRSIRHRDHRPALDDSTDEKTDRRLYLVIHNIDGVGLRDSDCQDALSAMAKHQLIHVVASLDHIHGPLLWTSKMWRGFDWRWEEVATHEPYSEETRMQAGSRGALENEGSPSNLRTAGIHMLMQSLTKKALGIVKLIAEHSRAYGKSSSKSGASLTQEALLNLCQKNFLASNPRDVRTVVTELMDHNLLVATQGMKSASDSVVLAVDPAEILSLLEAMEHAHPSGV